MSNKRINREEQIILDKEIDNIRTEYEKSNFYNNSCIDLTHLKTYTIDDKDTREIDDAISLEKNSDNYKLWIHIASPPAFIEYDSAIDLRARKLISTLYLSTSNIYMLPEVLIDEIFSLRINEKKAAISLGVIFNNDGNVFSYQIVRSLIKANYTLTYEEADELIDYAPKEEEDLSIIFKILENRNKLRKNQGANEILESYGKIIVKNDIPSLKVIDPTLSRLLISEAMILYGDLISNYTKNNKIPVPYRVQEISDISKINIDINRENEILYNFHLKKSMGKTYYSSKPLIHKSLGLSSYLHATSPIRRYSDLLVHYQINRFLIKKVLIPNEEIENNITEINRLGRQNVNKFREDQKIWISKWFEQNNLSEYNVIFLNWINRYKNICIIYFLEFSFSTICYLKTNLHVKDGDNIIITSITVDYNDLLYFKLS